MSMRTRRNIVFRLMLEFASLFFVLGSLAACHAQQSDVLRGNNKKADYILLGLVGYNYTDRHISSYSVDGAGGGHINQSSPTSGGSGVTCCVRISKTDQGPIRVKVRWQFDGCTYLMRSMVTNNADEVRHFHYKEVEVDVHRIPGESPNYIETHFYPDGSVRVFLTKSGSSPLLKLDERREDKSYFPRCKNDEEPE